MEENTTVELKLKKIKRGMEREPYAERQVRMRRKVFCCQCKSKTAYAKDKCLVCDHNRCLECSFYQRLSRESKEAKVMNIQNDSKDRWGFSRDQRDAAADRFSSIG
jgi:hypothetical protein